MFKRSVVIGGLIAGAFLLPSLAAAGGSVKGQCVNCHTMHNSQDGAARFTTVYASLLGGTGCAGCHADPAFNNDGTGRGTGGAKAPQVDNDGSTGNLLNGGYFTIGNTKDANQHNVAGVSSLDATLQLNVPGGTARLTQLGCQDCHTASGHHAPAANKYRMLDGTGRTTTAQTDYGATAMATNLTSGSRAENVYQATDMNAFCAKCHGGFHGNTNQQGTAAAGSWVRHPTDVQVVNNATTAPSIVALLANGDGDVVPVGSTAAPATTTVSGTDGTIMCISCHVPHGGPYADLLSFNYNVNQAGGNTVSTGCETCHSYSSAGM